jgi:uncharacterized membrane protein
MKKTFSIKKLLRSGWNDFKKSWKSIIGAALIFIIIGILGQYLGATEDSVLQNETLALLVSLIVTLINVALSMGFMKLLLNIVDGKEAKTKDIFTGVRSVRHLILFIILNLLVSLLTFAGLLLVVIPGIIIAIGLLFAELSFVDKKMGVIETLKWNWRLTRGHRWWIFVFVLVTFLFNLLGLLALVVGLIITVPVTYLAYVRLYRDLEKRYSKISLESESEVVDVEVTPAE